MNLKGLLKTLNTNSKLTRNAITHYLSLLYLAINNPYPSDAYIATKVTSKELEKQGLLVGNISPLNDLLAKEGLIKRLEGQSRSVYILGEKHIVKTLSGKRVSEVWYFDSIENGEIKHKDKAVKSKAKTYNDEIKELMDFYWSLYHKKYEKTPVVDFPKTRLQLTNLFKQLSFREIKACLPIYMELDDDYLISNKYPLHIIAYRMDQCRNTLDEKIRYYEMIGKEDEFYKKYINKIIKDKKLTAHNEWLEKRDGGIIAKQNRGSNTKLEGGK